MSQKQLKVYLIRQELTRFKEILDSRTAGEKRALDPDLRWDGEFRVRRPFSKQPDWVRLVNPILEDEITEVKTSSSAALLLLRVKGRIFALTFGYGRSMLRPDTYERDFGMRVALNTVDPEALRSVDMQRIEELTVSTRRQTSKAADFGSFALDSSQDLLRGVTGIPREESFGTRVSGSEGLTLSTKVDLVDLPEKCETMLKAYEDKAYLKRFKFIDYMQIVRDKGLKERLDEQLASAFNSQDYSRMHLAPSEPESWENISGFTYSYSERATVYADLHVEEAVQEFRIKGDISADYLRRRPVGVRYRESETSADRYTVYKCLVFECELDGKLYVLSGGDWHQIEKNWADRVRARVGRLAKSSLALPASFSGEHEDAYSARVAKEKGWALMDKQIINLDPPHDRVEMCDLLTPDKQLIHVKRKTVSATLSHLFAQGRVSGELLFRSGDFRTLCREKAKAKDSACEHYVPKTQEESREFEVVYAIMSRTRKDWPTALPFFSQLNLSNSASHLHELGYRVSLLHVPADPRKDGQQN